MPELKYKDITEKIIGASFEVHKFLGNGFQEVIYQLASAMRGTSVKSNNPYKSVIQTSYDIVKAHGGSLHLYTNADAGSIFVIELPMRKNEGPGVSQLEPAV